MQETCAVRMIWHVSGRREALGNVAVHPDALMSMQPSFHRYSRPRKKVCPYWCFLCCPPVWHVKAGTGAGNPQVLPGAAPRFSFLFGNRVDGNWTIPYLGSSGGSRRSHFSFGFGHFLALPAGSILLLRLTQLLSNAAGVPKASAWPTAGVCPRSVQQ